MGLERVKCRATFSVTTSEPPSLPSETTQNKDLTDFTVALTSPSLQPALHRLVLSLLVSPKDPITVPDALVVWPQRGGDQRLSNKLEPL